MPILPPEPACYPDGLFTDPSTAIAMDARWSVLHLKSRQEKCVLRDLRERRVACYLPLVERRLRIRERIMTSRVPLFDGYVFLLGGRPDLLIALSTRRVVRVLEVIDQQQLWHDLRQVHRLIATGAPLTRQVGLTPGTLVEIRGGPLAGLQGKVLRTAKGHRFIVQVNFIQQGASILLDGADLARLELFSPAPG
jgi:transcriptional antiterminator RfaH